MTGDSSATAGTNLLIIAVWLDTCAISLIQTRGQRGVAGEMGPVGGRYLRMRMNRSRVGSTRLSIIYVISLMLLPDTHVRFKN